MRKNFRSVVIPALALVVGLTNAARAALVGQPLNLKYQLQHIRLDEPALPPMAHVKFCMAYPADCRTGKLVFRGGATALTPQKYADLVRINAEVNRSIVPERNERGPTAEEWLVAPARGDCNDYAVTKRHALLASGWPARNLLLAEVVTRSGEHHLVLVIRTRSGDLVVDNLNANVRPWSKTDYVWVRMQSPENARFWKAVSAVT